jgi:SAM-dependent methyltransferase
MLIEAEQFSPASESTSIIEKVSRDIRPDADELGAWFSWYVSSHSARLAFDLEIIKQHANPTQSILEYGAVPFLLTGALKKSGYRIIALDIAPERFSNAINQLGLEVRKCDVEKEKIPFADKTFDVVIFNELFEHLRINLIFTMKEVHRILKSGGKLLLSTPNLRSLRGIRNFLFRNLSYSCSADVYSQFETLEKLGYMGHMREYTTREVAEFLEKVGFSMEKIIFRGQYNKNLQRAISLVFPSLRPFISIVALKN